MKDSPKPALHRRDFLKQSALAAAAALSLSPLERLTMSRHALERTGAPKKVLILGAGLAGLSAAYELMQVGHDVTILEARMRPGGRVQTLRDAFSDGLYAEAGAARIPSDHEWTMKYVKLFELPLEPMYPSQLSFLDFSNGERHEVARDDFTSALGNAFGPELGGKAERWFKIKGGSDLLPKAFSQRLADKIHYGAAVVRIEQDAQGVRAVYVQAGEQKTMTAERLLCALPFSTLRNIEVAPAFPAQKQKAINRLEYYSVSRVYLQTKRRFWEEKKLNGFALTNNGVEIWHPTHSQPAQRGLLMTYVRGAELSHPITQMKPDERVAFTVKEMERIHPGVRQHLEGGASKCWDEDEWSRGAWAAMNPLDMVLMAQPEGRLHFAGEHLSLWPSWMQGALASGNTAAKQINEAA